MTKLSTWRAINLACQGLVGEYIATHWADNEFLADHCGKALLEELQQLPEEKQIGALELAIKYSFPRGIDWQRAERSLPDKAMPYEFFLHVADLASGGREIYRSDWGFALDLKLKAIKKAIKEVLQ